MLAPKVTSEQGDERINGVGLFGSVKGLVTLQLLSVI